MTDFPPPEKSGNARGDHFTPRPSELDALKGIQYVMPRELEAFYDLYARPHLRYADTMLGDKQAAKTVVRRLYSHLALNWAAVLKEESPEAYAWKVLKQRVELHLRMTGSPSPRQRATVLPDRRTTVLQHAARATLEAVRQQFAAMDSTLGLFTAIAALPERQYDVIVLHYVLGYPTRQAAYIMGIEPDTVRAHRRSARERIASKLGLDSTLADDEEKE